MLYYAGNVAGIIGWLFLIYSYYKEDIDKILYVQIISSIFYCLNYLLLGATAGLLICVFELIKQIIYYKTDLDDYVFLSTLIIYVIIGYFSFEGWFTLLPVIGSVIDGFSLTKNKNVAVIGGILSNILWVIYDVLILSYSCALTDGILVLSNISIMILGYSRLIKTDKFVIRKCFKLTRNISHSIINLDKKIYGDNYLWESDYQKKLFDKNNDSLLIISYKNKILGYINYLCVTEEEYMSIKEYQKFKYKYNENNIIKFEKNKNNYLLIDSICVDSKYQNYRLIKIIKNRIGRLIKEKYKDKCNIKGIISFAITEFENDVLNTCCFKKINEYDNYKLYELNQELINENYITDEYKLKEKQKEYKIIKNEKITDEIFDEIIELDKQFYKDDYQWTSEYQKELFEKNKNSLIVVMKNNKLVGYLNYLSISESKHNDILKRDEIVDEYEIDEIMKYSKVRKNYITLNSIVIDLKYQNGITVRMLTNAFKKEVRKLHNNGYKIKGISATAVSKDGRKFLEELKFEQVKKLKNDNYLYVLEGTNLKNYLN